MTSPNTLVWHALAVDDVSRAVGGDVRAGLDPDEASRRRLQFGPEFRLVASERKLHTTPAGARQALTFCVFRFEPTAEPRAAA